MSPRVRFRPHPDFSCVGSGIPETPSDIHLKEQGDFIQDDAIGKDVGPKSKGQVGWPQAACGQSVGLDRKPQI